MTARWSTFTKAAVVGGLLLVGVWLLSQFHALVGPVVTALLLAYVLNLPVGLLTRRTGMGRTLVTVIVFTVAVLLLIALPIIIGPRLVSLVSTLQIDIEALLDAMEQLAAEPVVFLNLQIQPQSLLDQVVTTMGSLMSPVATGAFNMVAGAAEALGWLIFVLVVAFLLVKDLYYFTRIVGERVPATLAPELYRLGQELGDIWNAYFRGQLLASLVVGFMTTLGLWLIGLPSALSLGVLAGILNFVPNIGPILAAIPAVILALVRGSSFLPFSNLGVAVLVVIVYVVVGQVENLYLRPIVIGRRVRLHPVVVIIGTVGGALVAGILGILLAAPVMASARVLLGYTYRKLLDQEPFKQYPQTPQTLGVQWRGFIRGRAVEAVLFDLDGTLVETDDRTVAALAARLARFKRILPDRNVERTARRFVMWASDWLYRWMAFLDRFGMDRAAQRWLRRLHLLEDHSDAHDLMPVANTLPLLHQLSERYKLGIVSTRREEEIRTYLDRHGLDGQVQVLVGFDSTERIKPHPQPLLWAAEQLDVSPQQVIMVGDTTADVQAAKAAGALAVGVLCGFGETRDLEHADLILDTTADLLEWL
jgi:HAD superfamily hydrolase (TIGR01549 family)